MSSDEATITALRAEITRLRARVAELEQETTHEAYHTLVDNSLQGLIIYQDGRCVFANQRAAEVTGYTVAEQLAMSPDEAAAAIHPDDRAMVTERGRQRQTGEAVPERYELRIIRKDGQVRWLEAFARHVTYQGRPAAQMAYIDITERKQAEEAYHTLVDNSLQGLIIYQDTGVVFANPRMAEITGYRPTELVAMPLDEVLAILHPDDRPMLIERGTARLAGQAVLQNYAHRIIRKDGAVRWLEVFAVPTTYQGRPAVQMAYIDITERKQAAAALHEAHERLEERVQERTADLVMLNRALQTEIDERQRLEEALLTSQVLLQGFMEYAPAFVYVKDAEGRYVLANRRLTDYLRETLGDVPIIGQTVAELSYLPAAITDWLAAQDRRVLETGEPVEFEKAFPSNDGSIMHLLAVKFPIYNSAGTIVALGGISNDITERKRAQEALRESEARFAAFMDCLPGPAFIHDQAGRVLFANQMYCQHIGLPPGEVIGQPFSTFLSPALSAYFRAQDQQVLAAQQVCVFEDRAEFADQTTIFMTTKFPIQQADGSTHIGGIAVEITERKALEEQLQFQARLLNEVGQAVIATHPDGTVIYWNRAAEEIYGWLAAEGLGQQLMDLIVQEDLRDLGEEIMERLRSGERSAGEFQVQHRDGRRFPIFVTSVPILDKQGQVQTVIGVSDDISERKRAEEALQQHEAFLRTIYEGTQVSLFILNVEPDGGFRVVGVNPAFEQATGLCSAEVLGKLIADVPDMPPEEAARLIANYAYCVEARTVIQYEELMVFRGKTAWWLTSLAPRHDTDGRVYQIIGSSVEITERKQLEDQLQFQARLLNEVGQAVIATHPDGTIIYWNRAAERIYGWQAAEAIGRNISEVVPAEGMGERAEEIMARLQTGNPWSGEFRVRHRSGRTFWAQVDNMLIQDEQGQVQAIIGISSDITERKHAEEAYRTLVDNSLQGLLIYQDGHCLFTNTATETITGYTAAEVMAMAPEASAATIHPDDRAGVSQRFVDWFASAAATYRDEYRIIRKDGGIHWIEVFSVRTTYHERPAVQVAFIDITERKQLEDQLQFQARLLNEVGQAVIATHPDGTIIYWNRAAEQIYGWQAAEAIGQHVSQVTVVEDLHAHADETIARLRAGESWSGEFRAQRRDGTIFWAHVYDMPILDEQGQVQAIIGVSDDITERKHAEEAYRTLVDNSLQGLVIYQDGKVVFINHAMTTITGYSMAEQQAMSAQETAALLHPDDRTHVVQRAAARLAGEQEPQRYEHRIIRKDGTVRWLEVFAVPTTYQEHPAVQVASVDITERKQAEADLCTAYAELQCLNRQVSRSRDLLHTLFDGLDDGLLLLHHDGSILNVNRVLAELLHHSPTDLVGKPWQEVCAATQPPFPAAVTLHTLRDGQSRTTRERFTNSDGKVRVLDMQTFPFLSDHNGVDRVILHVVDVTTALQMQEHLIEMKGFAAAGELAASVAHEVNTPLQSVMNALYFVQTASDEKRDALLTSALAEIKRAGNILNQLLNLYRPAQRQAGTVALNSLLERLLLLLGKRIREQGVQLHYDLPAHLPDVSGRSDELTQVLLNLLVNALDAMPAGGTLHVQTRPEHGRPDIPGQVAVIIRDSGEGIPAHLLPRIFEPFVTSKHDGTGLGLTICHQIVQQHGGIMTVTSQTTPVSGSTFTITLPASSQTREDMNQ